MKPDSFFWCYIRIRPEATLTNGLKNRLRCATSNNNSSGRILSSYRQLPCKGSPFEEFIGLNPINETSQATKIAGRIGGKCQHERVNIKIVSARSKHPNPPTHTKKKIWTYHPGWQGIFRQTLQSTNQLDLKALPLDFRDNEAKKCRRAGKNKRAAEIGHRIVTINDDNGV